jgi:hypothetical protein
MAKDDVMEEAQPGIVEEFVLEVLKTPRPRNRSRLARK